MGILNKAPDVDVTADNCHEETLLAVTDEDYRPYSFYNEICEPCGYDAELIRMIANRAKTVFRNTMSHGIRTPMNAIVGFAALAAKHSYDTMALTDYLGKINRSGEHLMSLIYDVLD